MKYKLSEIAVNAPSGGRIVGICEHKGQVMLATESHIFRGSFETGDFEQCCFRLLEEDNDSNDEASSGR